MDLYSVTLGLALAAAGVSLAAALAARLAISPAKARAGRRVSRWARAGAVASLLLGTFSLVFHLLTGHRPGTPEAMGPAELVLEHPSFVLVFALAVVVLVWLRREGG